MEHMGGVMEHMGGGVQAGSIPQTERGFVSQPSNILHARLMN